MKELELNSNEGFKRIIERYIPKQGIIDYGFICTTKKYMVKLHYMEEQKKTIHCFGGDCCKDGHKTNTYTIYLAGVYTDYKDEKAPVKLYYIRATKAVDDTLRALAEQFSDPKDFCKIDLQLFLDDSVGVQFKKLGIQPCVNGSRKATKEQLMNLKAEIDKSIDQLETIIADKVTPEEYSKLMSNNSSNIKPIPKVVNKPVENSTMVEASVEKADETEIDISDIDELL